MSGCRNSTPACSSNISRRNGNGTTIRAHVVRVPGGLESTREGGKVVSPANLPPLPRRKYLWYLCLLEVESTPGT